MNKIIKKKVVKKSAKKRTVVKSSKKSIKTKSTKKKKIITKSKVRQKSKTLPKSKAKKVTKRSTRKKIKKILVVAIGDQCFWIKDGPILKDLVDLRNVLQDITREQFRHHVDSMKNDFSTWVEYVLRDGYASSIINKAKSARAMLSEVEKSLKKYNH